jgi:hypothetical protein
MHFVPILPEPLYGESHLILFASFIQTHVFE